MKRILVSGLLVLFVILLVCLAAPTRTADDELPSLFNGDCRDWDSFHGDYEAMANDYCVDAGYELCEAAKITTANMAAAARKAYLHGMINAFWYAGMDFKITDLAYMSELNYYCHQKENRNHSLPYALFAINAELYE